MNKVQLSQKQIQELFDFTDRLNLTYKDVQCEIVDHLASGVEDYMQEHPKTTFNVALYHYVETLPFSFFSDLIIEKTKILRKYWTKKFLIYILAFLTIPKVIIFTSLIIIHFFAFTTFGMAALIGSILLSLILTLMTEWSNKKMATKQLEGKEYLILKTYYKSVLSFLSAIFIIPFLIPNAIQEEYFSQQTTTIIMCVWIAIFYISAYACWFIFPNYLKREIAVKYAHLNIQLT